MTPCLISLVTLYGSGNVRSVVLTEERAAVRDSSLCQGKEVFYATGGVKLTVRRAASSTVSGVIKTIALKLIAPAADAAIDAATAAASSGKSTII